MDRLIESATRSHSSKLAGMGQLTSKSHPLYAHFMVVTGIDACYSRSRRISICANLGKQRKPYT